jgi:hypothetical protein
VKKVTGFVLASLSAFPNEDGVYQVTNIKITYLVQHQPQSPDLQTQLWLVDIEDCHFSPNLQ